MKTDLEREYLIDDMLAKQAQWEEEEYFLEMERNKRLPAVIRVEIPKFLKKKQTIITTTNDNT